MSRLRPYIKDFPNRKKIKRLERKIIDHELELDQLTTKKTDIEDLIKIKKQQIIDQEVTSAEESSRNFKIINEDFSNLKEQLNTVIDEKHHLESTLFKCQNILDDEIKMGMIDLFHQAKKEYETAHNQWITCQQSLIEAKESLKNHEKKLETIKHIIRIEWEC